MVDLDKLRRDSARCAELLKAAEAGDLSIKIGDGHGFDDNTREHIERLKADIATLDQAIAEGEADPSV